LGKAFPLSIVNASSEMDMSNRLFDRIASSDMTSLNKARCFAMLQLVLGIVAIGCYMTVYRWLRGY
jgi:hypothetical protein